MKTLIFLVLTAALAAGCGGTESETMAGQSNITELVRTDVRPGTGA